VFGPLAEFERAIIRERTLAGLAAARARGRLGGRPPALTPAQVEMARALLADRTRPIREVCTALHVSRSTLYRHVPTHTVRPVRARGAEPPVLGPRLADAAAARAASESAGVASARGRASP
jgi:hypothetical protein